MENFLEHFELKFREEFTNQSQNYNKKPFIHLGLALQNYLLMKETKLEELFDLFAVDNQVMSILRVFN
jgi:hypothetical protein